MKKVTKLEVAIDLGDRVKWYEEVCDPALDELGLAMKVDRLNKHGHLVKDEETREVTWYPRHRVWELRAQQLLVPDDA